MSKDDLIKCGCGVMTRRWAAIPDKESGELRCYACVIRDNEIEKIKMEPLLTDEQYEKLILEARAE